MPKFRVRLCKRTRIYLDVEIEAASSEDAEEIAQVEAHTYDFEESAVDDHAEYEVCCEPEEIT